MDIKPIKTDTDYRAALKEVETLMTAKPNTPKGKKLDALVTLVEAYEHKYHPLDQPDPVEAIKFENGTERFNSQRPGTNDWKK